MQNSTQIAKIQDQTSQVLEDLSLTPSVIDAGLIQILEARFREAQLCLPHSPMATIMLCGSLLEGVLFGLANKKPGIFNQSPQAPKDENGKPRQFKDWSLAQFIDVAHGLGILRLDVKKFSHELRNFRNYIHPYQQLKEDFHPDRYTAEICLTVVKAAINNLKDNEKAKPKSFSNNWRQHPDATYLALAVLIGSWQDKSQCDLDAIAKILGISYEDWLNKARELLQAPDSPLSLKNGVWKVLNRTELWTLLGSRILDQNLDVFRSLAISVLKESDPAFELPAEERYAASVHGKVLKCSSALRKGIAEGLAILGNHPQACENCSLEKADATTVLVVREVLSDSEWKLWGSLNGLLPTLAEAAPGEFLDAVGCALRLNPCPFDELFSQEGDGITGGNYLTGLLWALEALAWDEQYLVRACDALAELASHDPGGKWANRPSNSLATILLPWLPQTLAPVEKRKVAVRTILTEWPEIAWRLIIQLLPGQHQTSTGSHKPRWRKTIPDNWEKGVTQDEYWQQVSFYAELAVELAGIDSVRLSALIEHLDSLPKPAFDLLLEHLASSQIIEMSEEQRLSIWDNLTKFTHKHRKYSDAQWALPDEALTRIELVADRLAPTNPTNMYQHLFSGREYELYDDEGNWEEQSKKPPCVRLVVASIEPRT